MKCSDFLYEMCYVVTFFNLLEMCFVVTSYRACVSALTFEDVCVRTTKIYVYIYMYIHTHTRTHTHTHIHIYTRTYICLYRCIYIYTDTCTHKHTHIQGAQDITCSYIPTHLEYIIFELLKNAMRAVCESHLMSTSICFLFFSWYFSKYCFKYCFNAPL